MHRDNKNKDILSVSEGPTQGFRKLAAEAKYPINFAPFVLSLYYNGTNSFLFANSTKIYQFNAKDFEVKGYTLCLGNISKDFTINNMKKIGLKGSVNFFSVDFNPIYTNDTLDIHKYLMKKHNTKQCLG